MGNKKYPSRQVRRAAKRKAEKYQSKKNSRKTRKSEKSGNMQFKDNLKFVICIIVRLISPHLKDIFEKLKEIFLI